MENLRRVHVSLSPASGKSNDVPTRSFISELVEERIILILELRISCFANINEKSYAKCFFRSFYTETNKCKRGQQRQRTTNKGLKRTHMGFSKKASFFFFFALTKSTA